MDYKAAVNPTFYTAQQTLFMLAESGNEDAEEYIRALGISNGFQEFSDRAKKNNPIFTEEEAQALLVGGTLAVEARYAAVSGIIKKNKYKNVLDIACGYTPRSLFCKKLGVDYVGVDVPAVVEQLNVLENKFFPDRRHSVYIGGDATNAASLTGAADLMEGELFITCEGLLMYLSRDELVQLMDGIRGILLKHGGAWYSSDMGVKYEEFSARNLGHPDAVERFIKSRDESMKASDIYYDTAAFKDDEERFAFLNKHGFKVEKIPYYYEDIKLNVLDKISKSNLPAILEVLNESAFWVMTPDLSYAGESGIRGASKVENLSIEYSVADNVLVCSAEGRIDTISAPLLLEIIENNAAKSMELDAEKLEYISSAGLRVLTMAVKKMGEGSVTVIKASDEVKEIFDVTGFGQIITVR